MAEKNKKNNPRPGIPDALHPEIGNGSLWENQTHAFLLRTPDPSKELDAYLNDPETKAEILETWTLEHKVLNGEETRVKPAQAKEEILPVSDKNNVDQQEENLSPEESQLIASSPPVTSTEESEVSTPSEALPDEIDNPTQDIAQSPEPSIQKAPKAGKRVRKAVKTVTKQEAKAKKESVVEPPLIPTESNLSPFTKWLKGLSGSDYVHPYDDDFAFTQSSGPGKEGISETFAELLAAQGYKDRAIEMYLKLMQKYPEKSGFFAAKIEALQ